MNDQKPNDLTYNYTFGALREHNPEAYARSVSRGGRRAATAQRQPEPWWLTCEVADFLRYLDTIEASMERENDAPATE